MVGRHCLTSVEITIFSFCSRPFFDQSNAVISFRIRFTSFFQGVLVVMITRVFSVVGGLCKFFLC